MFENNLIAGVSGQGGGYNIEDSLRFNDDDSAYLSRTPSVTGNRKTWTWSGWVKRGNVGISAYLLDADIDGSAATLIRFVDNDKLRLYTYDGSSSQYFDTTALFRDVSGWYHIVGVHDTTQSGADKLKLYVNGIRQAGSTTGSVADNSDGYVNSTIQHNLGRFIYVDGEYLDGYMAEVNFIDGQALTPDDFGEISEDTGEWSPKRYAGTYGTNGFYLPFNGNANDDSGNGNNWTENNLASTDYMIDTPTNNFSVLNPLASDKVTFQEGNLEATLLITDPKSAITTIPVSSGKWYAEVYYNSNTGNALLLGVVTDSYSPVSGTTKAWSVSSGGGSVGYFLNDGSKYIDGVTTAYGSIATTGDIIGIAFNLDDDEITFYKNNVSQGTITIKAFSGGYNFFLSNGTSGGNQVATLNQGADSSFAGLKTRQGNTDSNGIGDFYYTPPTGYLALCTDNLPAPAIEQPETQFNVVTYTGTGGTQAITGVGFQPDFVWLKERNSAVAHFVYDSVRGATIGIHTNLTDAEGVYSDGLTAFTSDGFTLGSRSNNNGSGDTYVAWCWKAGGTAVSNTDGTITSQVSANVDAGFSIVSWTANTSSPNTIGHGLSQAPDVIIGKRRSIASDWNVYHSANTSAPETETIPLNLTNATTDTNTPWNDTAPTASVFTVGSTYDQNETVIAYCFHSVEGFSKFGSYVGNGSTNGTFVYTGFKPAFVMVKRTDTTSQWSIWDSARNTYNVAGTNVWADSSEVEVTSDAGYGIDLTSNGFKLRNSNAARNASGGTYIYMAFAEHPLNYSTGR